MHPRVRPSVRTELCLHNILKSIGPVFTKLSALVHFWDNEERFGFWGQKV